MRHLGLELGRGLGRDVAANQLGRALFVNTRKSPALQANQNLIVLLFGDEFECY